MRVRVYRNDHRRCWSVIDCKSGRVVDHRDWLYVSDADLVVRQASRAFIVGQLLDKPFKSRSYRPISYNRRKTPSMVVDGTNKVVSKAKVVLLAANGNLFAVDAS